MILSTILLILTLGYVLWIVKIMHQDPIVLPWENPHLKEYYTRTYANLMTLIPRYECDHDGYIPDHDRCYRCMTSAHLVEEDILKRKAALKTKLDLR